RPTTCSPSISTPRARRQPAVLDTSAPDDRPRTRAGPSATAFRIRARCEIDLSPGSRTSPSSRCGALTVARTVGLPLPEVARQLRVLQQLHQAGVAGLDVPAQLCQRPLDRRQGTDDRVP